MNEADRRYSQTITLKVNFTNERPEGDVFRSLFRSKIGVGEAHTGFSLSHLSNAGTKEVYRITSAFAPGNIDRDNLFSSDKELLNFMLGKGNWDYIKVHVPTEPTPFRPSNWAIHISHLNKEDWVCDAKPWYSNQKEYCTDIKMTHPEVGRCNPHRFSFKYFGTTTGMIQDLEFKMHISTSDKDMLKASELETDSIMQTIVNACSKIGDMTHSFACIGEIEVEKVVSCGRYAHEEEE